MKKRDPTIASVPTASSHRSSIEPRGPPEFDKEHARQLSLAKRGRNNSLQATPRPGGADLSPIPSAGDGTSPVPDAPKAAGSRIKEFVSSHVTPLKQRLSPHPSAQDVAATPQDQKTASNGSSQTLNVPIPHHFTHFNPTDPMAADAGDKGPASLSSTASGGGGGGASSKAAAAGRNGGGENTATPARTRRASHLEEIASGISVKGILLIFSVLLLSILLCSLAVSDDADYLPDYFTFSYRGAPSNRARHGVDRFIPQFERQTALRLRRGIKAVDTSLGHAFPSVGLVIDDACMGVRFVLQSVVDYILAPIWNVVFRPNYFSRAAGLGFDGIEWLYHLPFRVYNSTLSYVSRTGSPIDRSSNSSYSATPALVVHLRRAANSVGSLFSKLASTLPFIDSDTSYKGGNGSKRKVLHMKTHHEHKLEGEYWPAILSQSPDFIYSEARGELIIGLDVTDRAVSHLKLLPDGLHMSFDVDHVLASNREWNTTSLKAEKIRLQNQIQTKLSQYTFPAMRMIYERRRPQAEAAVAAAAAAEEVEQPAETPKTAAPAKPKTTKAGATAVDCDKQVQMARQEEHAACDKARSALASSVEKQKKTLRAELTSECDQRCADVAVADKATCDKKMNTTIKQQQTACNKTRADLLRTVEAEKKKLRAEVEAQCEVKASKEAEVAAARCAKKVNTTKEEERVACEEAQAALVGVEKEKQNTLRAELEALCQEKYDEAQHECAREKASLTQALDEREKEVAEQQAACTAASTASGAEVQVALDQCRNESRRLVSETKKNMTSAVQQCKAQLSQHTEKEKELLVQIEALKTEQLTSEGTLKTAAEAEVQKANEALRKCREKLENKTHLLKKMKQTHEKNVSSIRKEEQDIRVAAVAAVTKNMTAAVQECQVQLSQHAEKKKKLEEQVEALKTQQQASEGALKSEAEAQRSQLQMELRQQAEAEVQKASEALQQCRAKSENKTHLIQKLKQTHEKTVASVRKEEEAIRVAAVAEAVTLESNKTDAVRRELEAEKAHCATQMAEAQQQLHDSTVKLQGELEAKAAELQTLETRLSESSVDQKQWVEQQKKHAQEVLSLRKAQKDAEEQLYSKLRSCEGMRTQATKEAETKFHETFVALNASHLKQTAAAKETCQAECSKKLEACEQRAQDEHEAMRHQEQQALSRRCDEKVSVLKKTADDQLHTCEGQVSHYKQQAAESDAHEKKDLEEAVQVLVKLSEHNCAFLPAKEKKTCEQRVHTWMQSIRATPLTLHAIVAALEKKHGTLAPVLFMPQHAMAAPAVWPKRLMAISTIGFIASLVALYILVRQLLALRRKNILLKSTTLKSPAATPHSSSRRHSKVSSYYTSDLYLVERTALDSYECLMSWHLACCNLLLEHELHSMHGVQSTIKGPGEPITTAVATEYDIQSPDDVFSQHTQTFSDPDSLHHRMDMAQLSVRENKGVEAYFSMLESYYVDLLEAITNRELVEEQLSEMEGVASEQQALLQKHTTAMEDLKKASALRETEMRMAQRKHQVEVGRLAEDLDRKTEEFAEERSLMQEQMAHLREEAQQAKHMRDLQSEMVAVLEEQLTRLSRTLSDVQGSQRPWRSPVGGSPARAERSEAAEDMSGFEQRLHELIRKDRDPPRDLESELDIFRSRGASERAAAGSSAHVDPATTSSPSTGGAQGYSPRSRQTMMRSAEKYRTPDSTRKNQK